MRLSPEEMSSVASFKARAEALKKQENYAGARMTDMYALQVINRAAVEMIKTGDIHDDANGKHEEFVYTDVSKEILSMPPDRKLFDLSLLLVYGIPLCNEILQVLEKHLEGK